MKPIFTSLSPNVEKLDLKLALELLFTPSLWVQGGATETLEDWFREFLEVNNVLAFNSGRSALLSILKSLDLEEGAEVLVPGFTCNALINPILWAGFKPVYVDIDEGSLNTDLDLVEEKITEKTRVFVAQHTFGLPLDMDRVKDICERHDLILVEDCAHALGAEYRGKKVGSFGDAAIFSLGRDKVVSSVFGGVAVMSDELAESVALQQEEAVEMSGVWVMRQLLHPILTEGVRVFYSIGIGRWVLGLLNRLGILNKAVLRKEKRGGIPNYIPGKMPNALAHLGLLQLHKLDRFLDHQERIVNSYKKGLDLRFQEEGEGRIYMRLPVFVEDSDAILKKGRVNNIFLNDGWRGSPVVPPDTVLEKMDYEKGMCPVAERISIVNLPTSIRIKEEERIIDLF